VASRKSAASLPRMVAWAAGRETASRYVLAEGTFATYAFSRRPLSARSYGRSGRRAKGRGCAKTSARFRTDLFRSLLRGLKALRIERIAKNFALLDPLQIFAEFLHGLGRFDPFAAPSGYDRYLRILAIASRSPKGRNPPKNETARAVGAARDGWMDRGTDEEREGAALSRMGFNPMRDRSFRCLTSPSARCGSA
jgi:hypothetical protein